MKTYSHPCPHGSLLRGLALAAMLASAGVTMAQLNLISNGGFETNTGAEGGNATSWTKDGAYGVYKELTRGGAHSGTWAYVVGNGNNSTRGVYQTLASPLVAGVYTLTFYSNPWKNSGNGLDVRVGKYSSGIRDSDASYSPLPLSVISVCGVAVGTWALKSYTFTALGGEDTIYFGAAALYTGEGADIDDVSLTQLLAPAAPTGLTATPTPGQVILNWTTSSGATGYRVWTSNSVTASVVSDTTTVPPYTKTGLDNGTTYYFMVSATNSAGASVYCDQVSATPTAAKSDQTITFALGTNVTKTFDNAPFADTATATSLLPVGYSSDNTNVATVDASGTVTIVGIGTAHILADQAGDESWNPAPQASQTLTVNKGNQTITFALGTTVSKLPSDAPFADVATASSGLPVTYSSDATNVATVDTNGTVIIMGAGTAHILADQAGDGYYNAAPQATNTLTVLVIDTTSAYPAAVLADSPLVYYRFEELPGTSRALDVSGHGRHGTYANVSSNGSFNQALGRAASFSNSSVAVPAVGTGLANVTVEVWLKPSSFSQYNAVYLQDGWSPGWLVIEFYQPSVGQLQFAVNGNTPDQGALFSGFVAGEWRHVVVTYESASQTALIYTNGTLALTQLFTPAVPLNLEAGHIGAWFSGSLQRYFDGLMDEFAIYGTVLTADRILAHYNTGVGVAITAQPHDAAAYTNQTATFTVEAVSYVGALGYRWLSNGVIVADATSANYTTIPLALANNGDTYRCVVSASDISIMSRVATVYVVEPTSVPGPLMWLTFEFDLLDQGGSTTRHDGSAVGDVAFDFGAPGSGSFNSINLLAPAYVDVANPTELNINSNAPFTIAAWILTDPSDSSSVIVGKAPPIWAIGTNTHTVALYVTGDGRLAYNVWYVGEVRSSTIVRSGNWMHVAVTSDGATCRLFVNGQPDGSAALRGANEGANGEEAWWFTLGQSQNTHFPGGDFTGNLDEVAFWSTALSPAQILGVFNDGIPPVAITIVQEPVDVVAFAGDAAQFTVAANVTGTTLPLQYQWQKGTNNILNATNATYTTPALTGADNGAHYRCVVTTGPTTTTSRAALATVLDTTGAYPTAVLADSPLIYYRFEEPTGVTTSYDVSGHENHGTYINISRANSSVSAMLGCAAGFNLGSVVVPAVGSGFSQVTIEVWLKPSSFSQYNAVYLQDGWSPGWLAYEFYGGRLQFAVNGNTPSQGALLSGFVAGEWRHVVATYDSAAQTALIYTNGTLALTQLFTPAAPLNLEAGHIGVWLSGSLQRYFDGLMDEFAIYGTVLSADRVAAHYAAGFEAVSPPKLNWVRAGSQVTFSWDGAGYKLQQNGDLTNPAGWSDAPDGGSSPVMVTVSSGNLFFRLKKL